MDNVTHALAGLLTAELLVQGRALRGPAPRPAWARRAWGLSALAHNVPDADVAYTWITGGPLGYLLHHRGHTHTLAFAPVAALLAWLPFVRRDDGPEDRRWLAVLAALGPLGHLALDLSNDYGVHPLWPLDNRWFYGDTIFILEPLFWAAVLPCVAAATRPRAGRAVAWALLVAALAAAALSGLVPRPFVLLAASLALALAVALPRVGAPARPLASLGACALVLGAFFSAGRVADARVREAAARGFPGWTILAVARTAVPATPLCWHAIVVQRSADGARYALRRARVSALPALFAADRCPLRPGERPGEQPAPPSVPPSPAVVFSETVERPLAPFRAAAARCDAGAFLRFSRAPLFTPQPDGALVARDFRYQTSRARGFSDVRFAPGPARCPRFVPPWVPPRQDLLAP